MNGQRQPGFLALPGGKEEVGAGGGVVIRRERKILKIEELRSGFVSTLARKYLIGSGQSANQPQNCQLLCPPRRASAAAHKPAQGTLDTPSAC